MNIIVKHFPVKKCHLSDVIKSYQVNESELSLPDLDIILILAWQASEVWECVLPLWNAGFSDYGWFCDPSYYVTIVSYITVCCTTLYCISLCMCLFIDYKTKAKQQDWKLNKYKKKHFNKLLQTTMTDLLWPITMCMRE